MVRVKTTRVCAVCQEEKPLSEFYNCNTCVGKKNPKCIPCHKAYTLAYRKRNPDAFLKKRYGITADEYDDLLREQGGVCAICSAPPTKEKRLSVDHDHRTGEVRGLLCNRCNVAIGMFDETPSKLINAVKYLFDFIYDDDEDEDD